jgi:hypothetical protein
MVIRVLFYSAVGLWVLGTGGKFFRLTLQPPLTAPSGRFLVLISVGVSVDPRTIVRLEELGKLKNPMNSSGIEPATFKFVA